MNRNRRTIAPGLVVIAACLCILWSSILAGAEEDAAGNPFETTIQDEQMPAEARTVTITGTINENYQLVSKQGTVYEIAETEAGDVMVQYVGEEVIAKGTAATADGQLVLSVVSFEFVEK